MGSVMTIAKRQFLSFVNTPAAYIVLTVVLFVVQIAFGFLLFLQGRATINEMFNWFGYLMPIMAPALTMGLIAEEKASGTIEILLTMPVKEHEVILGKFLGVYGIFLILIALSFLNPIVVSTLGDLDWGPVFTGYLGLALEGAAVLAVGLAASAWTKSQLLAFFLTLTLVGVFGWLLPALSQFLVSGWMGTVLDTVSLTNHLESMARGVIDSRDVVFFVSVTAVGLVVAFQALESRRWN